VSLFVKPSVMMKQFDHGRRCRGKRKLRTINFWLSENHFLVEKLSSNNAKFGAKNPILEKN